MADPTQEDFTSLSSAITALAESLGKSQENSRDSNAATKAFKKNLTELGSEILKVADAGRKFGQTIGVSATAGIELELKNRAQAVRQIITLEANRAASLTQIQAVEKSLADTFIGVRDGFKFSAQGAAQLASNLKGGFGSEFELTGESLRALTIIGATTADQFTAFRQATGRASLSSNQLATVVNKNTLSFLLYGNSFAKAAADAEKIGVSLASIQSAQAGLVTNLDSTIDTVAQLNQLGSQVDFGTLVKIAETEGPDALLAYLQATVPSEFFKSTSFRSLFEQLGVSSEQLLRAGQVRTTADTLDSQLSTLGTNATNTSKALAALSVAANAVNSTFGGLAKQIVATAAGTALGGGALSSFGKALGGTALAVFAPEIAAVAATAAVGYGLYSMFKGDDVISTYGERTLVTPTGAVALNNNDTVLAGTRLMSPGTLQSGDTSELNRKVDTLIATLQNANTTITIDGTTRTVPRMSLVGVYSRNERA